MTLRADKDAHGDWQFVDGDTVYSYGELLLEIYNELLGHSYSFAYADGKISTITREDSKVITITWDGDNVDTISGWSES